MADISYGSDAPNQINLIIEIKKGERNKYEFDKDTGRLMLDRVNGTAMGYPCDYGYVPDTLCEDGDPLDGLLVIDESVPHGVVVPARPIGVLYFEDEGEMDEKLVCLPADDVSQRHIKSLDDLGDNFKSMLEHFYSHYKDWKNDWQGVEGKLIKWGGVDDAKQVIQDSIKRAEQA